MKWVKELLIKYSKSLGVSFSDGTLRVNQMLFKIDDDNELYTIKMFDTKTNVYTEVKDLFYDDIELHLDRLVKGVRKKPSEVPQS